MPSSRRNRDVSYYPDAYRETLRRTMEDREEQIVELSSRTEANRIRGQFYGFIQALRYTAEQLEKKDPEHRTHADVELMNDAALASKIMLCVRDLPDGRVELVFSDRNNSWQAQAMFGVRKGKKLSGGPQILPTGQVVDRDAYEEEQTIIRYIGKGMLPAEEISKLLKDPRPAVVQAARDWLAEQALGELPPDPIADRTAAYGIRTRKNPDETAL